MAGRLKPPVYEAGLGLVTDGEGRAVFQTVAAAPGRETDENKRGSNRRAALGLQRGASAGDADESEEAKGR